MTLAERFWDKVLPEPNSGCWLWTGSLGSGGYGQIGAGGHDGRPLGAHRVSYEMNVGPIPAGFTLDHKCRVRCCVNPNHLEPVTRGENVKRGQAGVLTGAKYRAMTHCRNGHEYSPENTAHNKDGSRRCRQCTAARDRRAK